MSIDLDAIEARLAAATSGPWTAAYEEADRWTSITGQGHPIDGDLWVVCPEVATCEGEPGPDADLIAHAPEDLAALVAEVKRLRADVFTLRADARMADDINRDRVRERTEITRLRAVAKAAREAREAERATHFAAETMTATIAALDRNRAADDALDAALDALDAGGEQS